ncbi:ribonuclease T2 family protein [Pseudomonas sp. KNUC1026]|uniref:ribonuclease T2 family protein n=1 Tax=Pseudomonas sp. KNUC1026 TaxID=2893890 RepID=UPI001F179D35|nr:hypothetical protein [Pseudomonas sp. KNUC1026]UFH50971.1 hypothetical protein LN139_07825 [Pseudomonas sp. KNUC1026]
MTHDLWPYSGSDGERTDRPPQFCTTSPACNGEEACAMTDTDLNAVLEKKPLQALVTAKPGGMFKHEWRKHGTCSGKRKVFPDNTAFRCYRDASGKQYLHEVFYLIDEHGKPYLEEHNLHIGVQCLDQETAIVRGAS